MRRRKKRQKKIIYEKYTISSPYLIDLIEDNKIRIDEILFTQNSQWGKRYLVHE